MTMMTTSEALFEMDNVHYTINTFNTRVKNIGALVHRAH